MRARGVYLWRQQQQQPQQQPPQQQQPQQQQPQQQPQPQQPQQPLQPQQLRQPNRRPQWARTTFSLVGCVKAKATRNSRGFSPHTHGMVKRS